MVDSLVETSVCDNVLVLTICASHIRDADIGYALRDQMIAIVDQEQLANVVIDFGRVEFMGSIGFLALMSLRRHLADGQIVVSGLNEFLRGMFMKCRLISLDSASTAVFQAADTVKNSLLLFE
jgi:anti-anti-sigma regulatory factor